MLIAVGTVLAAVAVWRTTVLARWAAAPLAVAFVLFLPQYYAATWLRIAHGVLVAVGCTVQRCRTGAVSPHVDPGAGAGRSPPRQI
jgi:hypothetical protein